MGFMNHQETTIGGGGQADKAANTAIAYLQSKTRFKERERARSLPRTLVLAFFLSLTEQRLRQQAAGALCQAPYTPLCQAPRCIGDTRAAMRR